MLVGAARSGSRSRDPLIRATARKRPLLIDGRQSKSGGTLYKRGIGDLQGDGPIRFGSALALVVAGSPSPPARTEQRH